MIVDAINGKEVKASLDMDEDISIEVLNGEIEFWLDRENATKLRDKLTELLNTEREPDDV